MQKLKNLYYTLRDKGVIYILKILLFSQTIPNYALIKKLFTGKSGIEIGGPSSMFKKGNFIPIYNIVKSLDGCNFSSNTIWEGNINSGRSFNYYKNKTGIQYISEATELKDIADGTYDFVISSNCLEHVANPLKALKEWLRILKQDGSILLVLPNKKYFFDHKRQVALFSHLLEDLKNDTKEDDLTHLDEILALHDLTRDLPAGNFEQFKARSLKNFENRALHQHVFDVPLLVQIFNYFNLDILLTHEGPMNVIVGKKKTA
jgi:SAM-dependent methyltransferase